MREVTRFRNLRLAAYPFAKKRPRSASRITHVAVAARWELIMSSISGDIYVIGILVRREGRM